MNVLKKFMDNVFPTMQYRLRANTRGDVVLFWRKTWCGHAPVAFLLLLVGLTCSLGLLVAMVLRGPVFLFPLFLASAVLVPLTIFYIVDDMGPSRYYYRINLDAEELKALKKIASELDFEEDTVLVCMRDECYGVVKTKLTGWYSTNTRKNQSTLRKYKAKVWALREEKKAAETAQVKVALYRALRSR